MKKAFLIFLFLMTSAFADEAAVFLSFATKPLSASEQKLVDQAKTELKMTWVKPVLLDPSRLVLGQSIKIQCDDKESLVFYISGKVSKIDKTEWIGERDGKGDIPAISVKITQNKKSQEFTAQFHVGFAVFSLFKLRGQFYVLAKSDLKQE